ncbi:hypothetical protein ABKV19_026734, partial [Rosa sericea]
CDEKIGLKTSGTDRGSGRLVGLIGENGGAADAKNLRVKDYASSLLYQSSKEQQPKNKQRERPEALLFGHDDLLHYQRGEDLAYPEYDSDDSVKDPSYSTLEGAYQFQPEKKVLPVSILTEEEAALSDSV